MPRKTKQNNKKTQKKEIVLFISPMNYNNLIQVGGPRTRLPGIVDALKATGNLGKKATKKATKQFQKAMTKTKRKKEKEKAAMQDFTNLIDNIAGPKRHYADPPENLSTTEIPKKTGWVPPHVNSKSPNVTKHIVDIVKNKSDSQPTNIWFVTKAPEKEGDPLDMDIKTLQGLIQGQTHQTVIIDKKPYLIKYGKISKNNLESVRNKTVDFQTSNFDTNLKTVLINNDLPEDQIEVEIETVIPEIFLTEGQKELKKEMDQLLKKQQEAAPVVSVDDLMRSLKELDDSHDATTENIANWEAENQENIANLENEANKNKVQAEVQRLYDYDMDGGKRRKSKKTKNVRKHRGIVQTGGSAGKLRKGYKYTGRRLKNGQAEIKKVKQTRK